MKSIFAVLLFLIPAAVHAQEIPDYGFDKVHINQTDLTITAEITPVSSAPRVKPDLFYFWYNANAIHLTQGGFSGKLLNGLYSEFYLNKNLKEQGNFKKGLKDGIWKSWNEDGTLSKIAQWKNGVPADKDISLWQKLNPFKTGKHKADTAVQKKSN